MRKIILLFSLLIFVSVSNKSAVPTIFTIGDSTMANKSAPTDHTAERGWAMLLPEFLKPAIQLQNHAKNGRSSKSFRAEGLWEKVYEQLKPGDYVFIQFGHNDQKNDTLRYTDPGSTFRANLARYVTETREKGGIPVLFTSIVRRAFNPDGSLRDTHGPYIDAVREVAAELNVVCIDLNAATHQLVQNLGNEPSKSMYMWIEPTAYNCFAESRKDDTHLSEKGARFVAQLAVDSISTKIPELRKHLY
jgi:pectinesterase